MLRTLVKIASACSLFLCAFFHGIHAVFKKRVFRYAVARPNKPRTLRALIAAIRTRLQKTFS